MTGLIPSKGRKAISIPGEVAPGALNERDNPGGQGYQLVSGFDYTKIFRDPTTG